MEDQYYPPTTQSLGLPLSYAYDESEVVSSTQSPLRLFPSVSSNFENTPRTQQHLDQSFMTASPSTPQSIPESYNFANQLSMSQHPSSSSFWDGNIHCSPSSFNSSPHRQGGEEYNFEASGSYITVNQNDDAFGSRVGYEEVVPRTWEPFNPRYLQDNHAPMHDFHHSAYMGENGRDHQLLPTLESTSNEIEYPMEVSQDYPRLSMTHSPMPEEEFVHSPMLGHSFSDNHFDQPTSHPPFRVPSTSLSEDGNGRLSREMTAMEEEDQGNDEPYAKLIYRALMSKPNHSMVLQEIYAWFKEHTNKGRDSDSKGWMNSIRHNLSMNAAFKKTERKTPGDESKKSTEWVLEEFAIKDGVQSTTRYRKGNANKKFIRSDAPAPSRQRSGQKGGMMSTRNTLRMRRSDHPLVSSGGSLRIPRLDTSRRLHFQHHHSISSLHERQRSPLTPTDSGAPGLDVSGQDASGPYLLQKMQPELYGELGGFEGICGLEDVQGVHVDDGPVFATEQEMHQFPGFGGLNSHDHQF